MLGKDLMTKKSMELVKVIGSLHREFAIKAWSQRGGNMCGGGWNADVEETEIEPTSIPLS